MAATNNRDAIPVNTQTLCVILPSWVGDTVMATGLLRTCATQRPNTKLKVILRPALSALLEGLPYIDAIHQAKMKGLTGPLQSARILKKTNADAVLILPNSFRSALTARLAGVAKRIGYARDHRGILLTNAIEAPSRDEPISLLDYYQYLATCALGQKPTDMTPHLEVTDQQLSASAALLDKCDKRIVILNPGGNRLAKRWPAEKFVELGHLLTRELDAQLVITGAPSEAELVAHIADALPGSLDLAAKDLGLGTLKGVIRRACLMITNDTGPRHIAAALGTPVVTLFGPTDPRWTTLPGVKERLLVAEPFLPEERLADNHAALCNVDRITSADVLATAQSLLDET